jgi:hypothetical protein
MRNMVRLPPAGSSTRRRTDAAAIITNSTSKPRTCA